MEEKKVEELCRQVGPIGTDGIESLLQTLAPLQTLGVLWFEGTLSGEPFGLIGSHDGSMTLLQWGEKLVKNFLELSPADRTALNQECRALARILDLKEFDDHEREVCVDFHGPRSHIVFGRIGETTE